MSRHQHLECRFRKKTVYRRHLHIRRNGHLSEEDHLSAQVEDLPRQDFPHCRVSLGQHKQGRHITISATGLAEEMTHLHSKRETRDQRQCWHQAFQGERVLSAEGTGGWYRGQREEAGRTKQHAGQKLNQRQRERDV